MGHIETTEATDNFSVLEQKVFVMVSFMCQFGQTLMPVIQTNSNLGIAVQVFCRCG